MPEVTNGDRSSNGIVLRLTVTSISCSRSSAALPVHSDSLRSTSRRCVSVPPVTSESPPSSSVSAERVGVAADLRLVLAERVGHRDPEARRLRRDRVLERPALHPRHHGRVERLRVLLAAEDEAGARAGERLVRRRGHEVAVLDRVRLETRGDEPGEVRHVAEEERADLVRDRAEAVGLDRARDRRSRRRRSPSAAPPSPSRARRRSPRSSSRARRRSATTL